MEPATDRAARFSGTATTTRRPRRCAVDLCLGDRPIPWSLSQVVDFTAVAPFSVGVGHLADSTGYVGWSPRDGRVEPA